jgi:hypothetical protein
MPRSLTPIADPTSNTIGTLLKFEREGPAAAGVRIVLNYPPDPDGPFQTTVAQLSGASQTALVTIYNEVIALYRTARGYV